MVVCYVSVKGTDCAAAVDSVWKGDMVVCYVCVKGTDYASAVDGIWIDILVVRFLPLSFYAKKKVAERKARIRRIAPRYAALLFGAVSPLYIPLMTAQPIATVSVYTRNGRQALSLPFLKKNITS